ncbi:MAG: hypothetical protein QXD89_02305 [Candidatus Aenigmatarchaeota archaeon]
MHPLVKAMIGVLLVISAFLYIFIGIPGISRPALRDVLIVLNGIIPLFILLLGILIVWLEWDEWKIERELAKEEKKLEKEEKKKKTRKR